LLLSVVTLQTAMCQAHQKKRQTTHKKETKTVEPSKPLVRAIDINIDILNPLLSRSMTPGSSSFEASADVNLQNKWYPIWETGYAGANYTANNGTQFNGKSIFNRIGVNANLLKGNNDYLLNSILYAGIRIGLSSFSYDINNIVIQDDYWNATSLINIKNQHIFAGWGELLAGVRTTVFNNINMGWSVRLKLFLKTGKTAYRPWYIPGYGKTGGSAWGFTYTVGYTIPLNQKRFIKTSNNNK